MALKGQGNYANDVANHDDFDGLEDFNLLSSSTLRSLGQVTDKVEDALARSFHQPLPMVPLFEEAP